MSMTASTAVTIASGTSLSGVVDTGGATPLAIIMPASWTTANLTFQASANNSTYNNLYKDDGTEYTVTAAASEYIRLVAADFVGIRYLKVRSGTSGTPVTQGADRIVTVVTREV